MTRLTALTTLLLLTGASAQAQSAEGASASFGVSTLGLYGSAAYEVMPKLRLRGILAGIPDFDYEVDEEDAGTSINLDGSALPAKGSPPTGASDRHSHHTSSST